MPGGMMNRRPMRDTPRHTRSLDPAAHRAGSSAVELLACLLMAVLTLAVLLPAVSSARAAARRTACQNNLFQVTLAVMNYQETYAMFPLACVTRDNEPTTSGKSWLVSILPFVDQAALYETITPDGGSIDEFADPTRILDDSLRIDTYRCPDDVLPNENPFRDGYGTCNYSGNAGGEPLDPTGLGFLRTGWEMPLRYDDRPTQIERWSKRPSRRRSPAGIFEANQGTRFRDVLDGASNTLLVGERSVHSGGGLWSGIRGGDHLNDAMTDASPASRPNSSPTGYSSFHPGAVNLAMADGRVLLFSDAGAEPQGAGTPSLLQAISTRAGSEIVNEF